MSSRKVNNDKKMYTFAISIDQELYLWLKITKRGHGFSKFLATFQKYFIDYKINQEEHCHTV